MSDNLRLDRSFRPTAARNVIGRGHRLLDKLDAEHFTRRDTELLVTANAILLGIATQQDERANSPLTHETMQTIRKVLRDIAEQDHYAWGYVMPPDEALANRGLNAQGIAWALDEKVNEAEANP